MSDRPLAVDIDGTLTDAEGPRALDDRVLAALRARDAPVVVATGKALPYPVALCDFVGIPHRVVAENGGVSVVDDDLTHHGDPSAAAAAVEAYCERGHDPGWGTPDLVNRWRETERAVSRERPLEPLRAAADAHGVEVVDTGYAYHVKSPAVSKGDALEHVAARLDREAGAFLAVGDSANDVSMFAVAGEAVAVANADDAARRAADRVTDGRGGAGFLEALE